MDFFSSVCRNIVFFLCILSPATLTLADSIVSPLEDWKEWALDSHPDYACPWVSNSNTKKSCIWPGRLTLSVTERGAMFELSASIFEKKTFLQLPGDSKHWPLSVTINGKTAPVIERNKTPYVSLTSGKYSIKGNFIWAKTPSQLRMPQGVAIISLRVNGQDRQSNLSNGQLVFSNKAITSVKQSSDSLKLEVYRKIIDGVPVVMESVIKLSVSGKPRELNLGRALLNDSEIISLVSPVPARVENDGTIRAQLKAGEYQIKLVSRYLGNPEVINIQPLTAEWPNYEYVSFQSNTAVRQVKLSGPVSIDTSQINIPQSWSNLPTYKLSKTDSLSIVTEYRGDHSPGANELTINRDLWLAFNGSGITALDFINGSMNKDWRLTAASGSRIGRATVGGEPVLITSLDGAEGIEIRSPSIDLSAVSKIDSAAEFSAAGWDSRVDEYRSTLHLPPGWRVLHASGVDRISGTWLSKWDLWDIFILLIIVAVTRRLISTPVAALSALALLISYHELGNPLLLVAPLLIIIALLPVVSGSLKSLLSRMSVLFAAALVLALITFAVSTFRLAIYPSLERSSIGDYNASYGAYTRNQAVASSPRIEMDMGSKKYSRAKMTDSMMSEEIILSSQQEPTNLYEISENDKVQTGPGLPTWTWNSVHFESSGPVPAGQKLSVIYSSPLITALWRVLCVFLVALYTGCVLLRLSKHLEFNSVNKQSASVSSTAIVALVLLGTVLTTPQTVRAQDYPPQYLLEELEQRLIKPPECLPECASLNNGRIDVSGTDITISFDAYVEANIALPLPNANNSWQLKQVMVNGRPGPIRSERGLFSQLSKGSHHIELSGILNSDNASISFPLPVHNIQTRIKDWVVEGLVDGRILGSTLTLRSVKESEKQDLDTLKPGPVKAFASVNRSFSFGKQWRVTTTVVRIAPKQGAISISVPLLANEKLLTDIGSVENGEITVQLGHRQKQVSWVSVMDPTAQLILNAADDPQYVEQWTFRPSSLWRLTYKGIPSIKGNTSTSSFEPTFKPWASEGLVVSIRKPEGVQGPTHTVEHAKLRLDAGKQIQRSNLQLDIRSSLGEDYTLGIPEGAEILSYSIDGREMNIPAGNSIKVPLQPGLQKVDITFQEFIPIGLVSQTPKLLLPDSATNIEIIYSLPRDRWPLHISGPSIGPAMLYWGVLCVIILGAIVLPVLANKFRLNMPISLMGWILLGLGLSTVNSYGVLIIALMFFLLAIRKQLFIPDNFSRFKFNTLQCFIVLWVVVAIISTISAIPMGLLSNPEMKVIGNGSSSHYYNYYQDLANSGGFPIAIVYSVPILAYRIVMLLWSLWLATRIIQWAGWAWSCFVENGMWKSKQGQK